MLDPKQLTQLSDLQGFIHFAISNPQAYSLFFVLDLLVHDSLLLATKHPTHQPRSSGYRRYLK